MVGYKNAEMALCNQLKMRPNRIVRENTLKNVSPLCQRVSPFKTLHDICTSILCQRVTLYFKKIIVRKTITSPLHSFSE